MVSYSMQKGTDSSDLSSLQYQIENSDEIILWAESNLTAIGLYFDQLEERLASFSVARRDLDLMEERCADSELETTWLGRKID